jgi:hypothetical protein
MNSETKSLRFLNGKSRAWRVIQKRTGCETGIVDVMGGSLGYTQTTSAVLSGCELVELGQFIKAMEAERKAGNG